MCCLETSFRSCLEISSFLGAPEWVEFVVFLVVVDLVVAHCVCRDMFPSGGDFDVDVVVDAEHCDGFAAPSASDVEASKLASPAQRCFAVECDLVGA